MPDMNENAETQQEYFGKTMVVAGMETQEDVLKLRIENEQLQHKIDQLQGFLDHDIEYDIEQENLRLKAQIEKMKCCEICNHNRGGCSYHHNWTKECLENKHKYFELKE